MRHLFTFGLSACLLLGATSIAVAQDLNAPRTLSPRNLSPNSERPDAPDINPTPIKTLSGGINVQTLGNVSTEALGVLSGKDGFSSDMWAGVDRSLVEALIKTLPNNPPSEHLRIMQRRLLLSAAQPPQGQTGTQSLLSLRVSKLADMGQTTDVLSLLRSSPQEERNNDLAILETQSMLIQGQLSQACALSAGHMQASTDIFWLKTMAFCRILAKQTDQAMLSLSLLRESGDVDETYYNLMESLSVGEVGKVDNLPSPKALDLALIQVSKAKLSETVLKSDNPNLVSVLAKFAQIKTNQRIMLVQKAVGLGLLEIEDLRLAYKAIIFNEAAMNDPIARTETLPPANAQALLYQVSTKEGQLSVISSETMSLGLELAKKTNSYLSTAKLYQPTIAAMQQSIDMLWFAPQAVRALLAAGDWGNAKSWAFMLRNAAFSDAEAAMAWTKLRPLAALAGFDVAPQAVHQALNNWWAAQPETPSSFKSAALLYSMIDGLGLAVPNKLWLALMDGPAQTQIQRPKSGIWIKLNKAGIAGRTGETLLMLLHGLGDTELKDVDPTFMRDSLFALRMVGLEQNARMLAIEAALNAGL